MGGGCMDHSVVRVQKVQKVQRVQRGAVAADAADYKKRGRGWRRGLCKRVVSPQGKRLTTFCASLRSFKMCSLCIASAQGATAASPLRVADCPSGNAYKVSVTGLAFCVIWHDKHSADWLGALASPYPASPDFPRKRGQNKTPRNILFISISTVSTGCCAPSKRGKGGGASHQRGNAFPRVERGRSVFLRAKARL